MSEVTQALGSTSYGKAVTPHDVNNIGFTSREVIIGVAGNISVVWARGDETEVLIAIPAGRYAWRITRVNSTSTTATSISAYE